MMENGFGMGGMWLSWLLLLIVLVLLVVLAVRALGGGPNRGTKADGSQGRSRAREVLDERYASGELSTEEYRERLVTLGEDT